MIYTSKLEFCQEIQQGCLVRLVLSLCPTRLPAGPAAIDTLVGSKLKTWLRRQLRDRTLLKSFGGV